MKFCFSKKSAASNNNITQSAETRNRIPLMYFKNFRNRFTWKNNIFPIINFNAITNFTKYIAFKI